MKLGIKSTLFFLGTLVILFPSTSFAVDDFGLTLGSPVTEPVVDDSNGMSVDEPTIESSDTNDELGVSEGEPAVISTQDQEEEGSTGGWSMSNLSGFGLPNASITAIVVNILNWILMIFGLLGIIGFLISGIMYIFASGDEKMAEKAKEGMKYSIIGVVVGLAGLVAIGAIDTILNAGSLI